MNAVTTVVHIKAFILSVNFNSTLNSIVVFCDMWQYLQYIAHAILLTRENVYNIDYYIH